jgi:tetratricopeptide (TPR) repeat protein
LKTALFILAWNRCGLSNECADSCVCQPQKSQEDVNEKIEKALLHKNLGNEFFKTGENTKALYEYHYAINYINGLKSSGANEDQCTDIDDLMVTCNSNMAAVFLKNGKPERAVTCCKKVLEIDDRNIKGQLL